MKKSLITLAIILVALSCSNCTAIDRLINATPEERYFAAARSLETAIDVMQELRTGGLLNDNLHQKSIPIFRSARSALALMKTTLYKEEFNSDGFYDALGDLALKLSEIDAIRKLVEPEGEVE